MYIFISENISDLKVRAIVEIVHISKWFSFPFPLFSDYSVMNIWECITKIQLIWKNFENKIKGKN